MPGGPCGGSPAGCTFPRSPADEDDSSFLPFPLDFAPLSSRSQSTPEYGTWTGSHRLPADFPLRFDFPFPFGAPTRCSPVSASIMSTTVWSPKFGSVQSVQSLLTMHIELPQVRLLHRLQVLYPNALRWSHTWQFGGYSVLFPESAEGVLFPRSAETTESSSASACGNLGVITLGERIACLARSPCTQSVHQVFPAGTSWRHSWQTPGTYEIRNGSSGASGSESGSWRP